MNLPLSVFQFSTLLPMALSYSSWQRRAMYISTNIVDILTHWGRVTHICVGTNTNIGPANGLSPGRRQGIIWSNAGILLTQPLGTNFSEILIGIQTFSFKKMHLKMASAKWRLFCPGLNVLTHCGLLPTFRYIELGLHCLMMSLKIIFFKYFFYIIVFHWIYLYTYTKWRARNNIRRRTRNTYKVHVGVGFP